MKHVSRLAWALPTAAGLAALALVWTQALGKDATSRVAPYRLRLLPSASPDQEIAFFEERVRRNPDSGLELASLANAYLKKARSGARWYDRAEETARRSLERLAVFNIPARVVLAEVAQARHDFRAAIRLSEEILKEKPRQPDAVSILVTANLGLGRVEEASRWADELIDRMPAVGTITQHALVMIARGKERQAIRELTHGIALEDVGEVEASSKARALLGRIHLSRGRLAEARDLLTAPVRPPPAYPPALALLGDLELRDGDRLAAERCYTRAYQLSGEAVYLAKKARAKGDDALRDEGVRMLREELGRSVYGHRRQLAEILIEKGCMDEAVSLMREETMSRRDAETMAVFARALAGAGRSREAQGAIREALRSGVEEAWMYQLAGDIERALGNEPQAHLYASLARELTR